jgi:16S rRNA (uracil1498-N3)-methyltransferase
VTASERLDSEIPTALPAFFFEGFGRAAPGAEVRLDAEEAGHARVRRLRPGAAVALVDGRGSRWIATLAVLDRRSALCTLDREAAGDPKPLARLWAPVGNKDRALWLVEKAVEVGAAELRLVEWERSRSVADAGRSVGFLEKCARRAREALKQCGGTWLPEIEGPTGLDEALDRLEAPARETRWLLDPAGAPALEAPMVGEGSILLVGPEGGATPGERDRILECGFAPVALGPRVLRYETAALAGLVLANARSSRGTRAAEPG